MAPFFLWSPVVFRTIFVLGVEGLYAQPRRFRLELVYRNDNAGGHHVIYSALNSCHTSHGLVVVRGAYH